ncbi:Cytochrome c-type bioproteinis protein CycK [Alteripontixanthobacter maritimus]|uniref:Cytochrome c-type bioproteinis protein CycK n=1 Tax=Alteripontixanthobacter maritimus TaxID=2161824 RepID=A0A369QAS4_9SPHN|nr:heme lyase CcmF/NrfE family subunit [Alteripontixanthobacter maritimus]RDC60326.1 Cytochrome c-type bioproteinis protein CycK [Alteripontixanthobacter maritimus]
MIAELGLAALWLAAALSLLQLVSGALSVRTSGEAADEITGGALALIARPAAIMQGALAAFSFAMLLWLFVRTDLSVALVAANSHSAKPFIFKLAGTWGNHEGSMLLWVTVMALSGALIAGLERRLPERTMQAVLAAQGFVALGFYAFLLFSSNPFARLAVAVPEGLGLNPLLQDIGLAFHPPTLYIGYVGLSVAFSFAVGALLTRQVTPDFARAMRPWVLGAWIFLTAGIVAGSYWAYYELGWGGWWFWDPVENASLMPWLAATALLHSVSVLAQRDALRAWTMMLAVIAFSMSMVGTFLVRSGVLTSVHAFAVDPERGSFILALLAIYIGGALAVFAVRAGAINEGQRFNAVSREGALVFNNLMLTALLGIVLFGTLYPLLTEAFGVRVSVGPPYFNPVSAIFALPMVAIMAVGPLLRWRRDRLERSSKPLVLVGVIAIAALVTALALGAGMLSALGIGLAAGLAIGSFAPLAGRNILRVKLATWGMMVAHFGIAVALFGMASDSAFALERLASLRNGETTTVGPWSVRLDGVEPVAGPNWTAMEGRMAARYKAGEPVIAAPQARTFFAPVQETTESALITRWNGQLYAVLGRQTEPGVWQVRVWWKPFVTMIFLGGILVALGGLLALIGRLGVEARQRYIRRRIADRRADEEALA